MNPPTDVRTVHSETPSRPLSLAEVQTEREIFSGGMGAAGYTGEDILRDVSLLAEALNRNPRFLASVAGSPETTLVLSATDTGREIMVTLSGQGLRVRLWADEPFDVKIEATEKVHWAVLSGEMDADAAFFTRKVRIRGSIFTAFRVKNKFLSFLQRYLRPKVQRAGRSANSLTER